MEDMEMMENENIIVLTDEDGVDVEFEFCAAIEYEGNEYVVSNNEIGALTQKLYDNLTGIQWGKLPDDKGWIEFVCKG